MTLSICIYEGSVCVIHDGPLSTWGTQTQKEDAICGGFSKET